MGSEPPDGLEGVWGAGEAEGTAADGAAASGAFGASRVLGVGCFPFLKSVTYHPVPFRTKLVWLISF